MEHMSATRSVVRTLDANFVIGFMRSTCGRSCREPMRCWLSAPWPPIRSIGLSARSALATPVTASVVPGPAVTTAQPGRPVTRAYPSAAWAATCSWRTSTTLMPSSMHPS